MFHTKNSWDWGVHHSVPPWLLKLLCETNHAISCSLCWQYVLEKAILGYQESSVTRSLLFHTKLDVFILCAQYYIFSSIDQIENKGGQQLHRMPGFYELSIVSKLNILYISCSSKLSVMRMVGSSIPRLLKLLCGTNYGDYLVDYVNNVCCKKKYLVTKNPVLQGPSSFSTQHWLFLFICAQYYIFSWIDQIENKGGHQLHRMPGSYYELSIVFKSNILVI
jgi:hypothetical protein